MPEFSQLLLNLTEIFIMKSMFVNTVDLHSSMLGSFFIFLHFQMYCLNNMLIASKAVFLNELS